MLFALSMTGRDTARVSVLNSTKKRKWEEKEDNLGWHNIWVFKRWGTYQEGRELILICMR